MSILTTTRMSSRGQVVIPEEIRNRLGFHSGDRFVVVGERDVVILKSIATPSMDDFDRLIAKVRKQVRLAGLRKSDLKDAVASVRSRQ